MNDVAASMVMDRQTDAHIQTDHHNHVCQWLL